MAAEARNGAVATSATLYSCPQKNGPALEALA